GVNIMPEFSSFKWNGFLGQGQLEHSTYGLKVKAAPCGFHRPAPRRLQRLVESAACCHRLL
ncbi:MAG TPA: hypothetical protein VG320_20460, partial [Paraburkholderia sp.]|uniref:hypothetical protein n=1 Tax=Paraburkholderia sp. TaxID=1926495 RepID=UPI002DF60A0D|nr:hypothetical protein [Paraburkholderia sp.]